MVHICITLSLQFPSDNILMLPFEFNNITMLPQLFRFSGFNSLMWGLMILYGVYASISWHSPNILISAPGIQHLPPLRLDRMLRWPLARPGLLICWVIRLFQPITSLAALHILTSFGLSWVSSSVFHLLLTLINGVFRCPVIIGWLARFVGRRVILDFCLENSVKRSHLRFGLEDFRFLEDLWLVGFSVF